MKNELPYMPVVVAEERALAGDLTNEELGAYYRIKLALWDAGGYLDEDKLIRTSRAGKRWGAMAKTLLDLLTVASGKVSCGAVLLSLIAVRDRRAEAADRAARAAAVRWGFESAHARSKKTGEPLSDVAASRVSDTLLKSAKPLKGKEATMLGASSEQCLDDANQNQKNIDSRIFTTSRPAASGAAAGSAGGSKPSAGVVVDNRQREVLYAHGVELLVTRMRYRRLAAHGQIANWLGRIGDADRLAMLLGAADQENLEGAEFFAVVEQRVAEYQREQEKGLSLPFDRLEPGARPRVVEGGRDE